jgi:hypothetical protein
MVIVLRHEKERESRRDPSAKARQLGGSRTGDECREVLKGTLRGEEPVRKTGFGTVQEFGEMGQQVFSRNEKIRNGERKMQTAGDAHGQPLCIFHSPFFISYSAPKKGNPASGGKPGSWGRDSIG